MSSNKLTYSKTIEVSPEHAELLNYLIDRLVTPVIERRIVQGGIPNGSTPEKQLESIINFGRSEGVDVPTRQQPKNIAQGGLNSKELEDLRKILKFGIGPDKPARTEKEGEEGARE